MTVKRERTRLISRGGGQRDAWLFVIAAEGSVTEKQYFEGLREHAVVDPRRVRIEVIGAADDTASAPQHVLSRLDEFEKRHSLSREIDQLWLVMDLDHWREPSHLPNLDQVIQRARQKGYRPAVSNPCFELWLLLHFTDDVSGINVAAEPRAAGRRCIELLQQVCGSYNKSNLQVEHYNRVRVLAAINRTCVLDTTPEDRWPQTVGTHVYRLAHELLQKSQRNAFPSRDA